MVGEPMPPVEGARKALVIFWEPESMEIELDMPGLSWFDVKGLCEAALDITEQHLPEPNYAYSSEETTDDSE